MIALAPAALLAAAGIAVSTFSLEHTSAGWALIARTLASLATDVFAVGYAFVMCGALRHTKHVVVNALAWISVLALAFAALITTYQLLVVNDTVAPVIRAALWALVLTGIVSGAIVVIARRTMAQTEKRPARP